MLSNIPNFAETILGRRPQSPLPGPLALPGPVLVTGAAGYIGSALCRFLLARGAAEVIGLDIAESPLAGLQRQMPGRFVPELADIRDRAAVAAIFCHRRPAVVFHAAAYKQVPLLEQFPFEAFLTNTIGTAHILAAAESCGAGTVILVSTDKAVHPISVLGASKRFAELLIGGRGISVRFGNVFGSTGSVVPIFAEQIAHGGPVTVTHAAARRFFITGSEAVQALAAAAQFAPQCDLLVYAPAPPLLIRHLAARMIHALAGTREIGIRFDGLRPGERLFERLTGASEESSPAAIAGMLAVKSPAIRQNPAAFIPQLAQACHHRNRESLEEILRQVIPHYAFRKEVTVHDPERSRRAG